MLGEIKTSIETISAGRPVLDFLNVSPGQEQKQLFSLFNDGSQDVTISEIQLSGGHKALFRVEHPKLPLTLKGGGEKHIIRVYVTTKEPGEFKADLLLMSSDAQNVRDDGSFPIRLQTSGTGPIPVFDCQKKLDFGSIEVGKLKDLECKVSNKGGTSFSIQKAEYRSEKGSKAFTWLRPRLPYEIPAGGSSTIKIRFSPVAGEGKSHSGRFVLYTFLKHETDASRHALLVKGEAANAALTVIPMNATCQIDKDCTAIDPRLRCRLIGDKPARCQVPEGKPLLALFPYAGVGTTSKARILLKSGSAPVKIDKLFLTGGEGVYRIEGKPTLPLLLKPQSSYELLLSFTPKEIGKSVSSTLSIATDIGGHAVFNIQLESKRQGCSIGVTPSKLSFVGAGTKRFTVYATGNQACLLKRIFIEPGGSDFALIPEPKPNGTLVPGGRIDFMVRYTPRASSAKATLVIQSDERTAPRREIPLEGKQSTGDCKLAVVGKGTSFGSVPLGESHEQVVKLVNKGNGKCQLSRFSFTQSPVGTQFFTVIQKPPVPSVVLPQQAFSVVVRFAPRKTGNFKATILLSSNDVTQPNMVIPIQGHGGMRCLLAFASQVDFGYSKTGCSVPKRVLELHHSGEPGCPSSITIKNVTCEDGGCFPRQPKSAFRIHSMPALPLTLKAYQSMSITVSFKPSTTGPQRQVLRVTTNSTEQPSLSISLKGEGTTSSAQSDFFHQVSRPKVDLLFVMDDSCSMGDEQAAVGQGYRHFIGWAVRLNVDYHIGVVTTDSTGHRFPNGCLRGTTKIITPSTPNASATFAQNIRVGVSGSGLETGIESSYGALSWPMTEDPKCNKGFLRRDADLSIVYISDEHDSSKRSLTFYTSFLKNLKGEQWRDKIRVSSIVGPPPSGCRSKITSALGGPKYWSLAGTFQGVQQSICDGFAGKQLSGVGSISFRFRTEFRLSRAADPKTIKVQINGNTVPQSTKDGWSYDAKNNSILFSKNQTPAPRATISVRYNATCLQ